jgi:hypothetical protein
MTVDGRAYGEFAIHLESRDSAQEDIEEVHHGRARAEQRAEVEPFRLPKQPPVVGLNLRLSVHPSRVQRRRRHLIHIATVWRWGRGWCSTWLALVARGWPHRAGLDLPRPEVGLSSRRPADDAELGQCLATVVVVNGIFGAEQELVPSPHLRVPRIERIDLKYDIGVESSDVAISLEVAACCHILHQPVEEVHAILVQVAPDAQDAQAPSPVFWYGHVGDEAVVWRLIFAWPNLARG